MQILEAYSHIVLRIGLVLCIFSGPAQADLSSQENPKFNSSINPEYNSSINPKYNSSINPEYNSTLNPDYNSSINPNYNSSINPDYNSSVNPDYNSAINPTYNSSLAPSSESWSGYYLFDLESEPFGIVVFANRENLLVYSGSMQRVGNLISNGEGGYNWFNLDNDWIAYAQTNSESGFNVFNMDHEWIAFMD